MNSKKKPVVKSVSKKLKKRIAQVASTQPGFPPDGTERKQEEKAILGSEARYRHLLDSMLEGCQIIGFDWRYLYVNDAVARHGQKAKEILLGHTMMEIYPGIENTELFASLRRCMNERTPQQMENEFVYPDGMKGWFELSIQPVPEGIFILSIDITGRKRAEEALQRSEQETAHVNKLLVALGEAAQSVQRALTTEEVYRAIQDHMSDLGLHATGFELEQEGKRLRIAFISYRRDLVHRAENATGLSLRTFHFQPRADTIFHRTIFKRETIYIKDTAQAVADALPRSLRALSRPVAYLFRLGPSIYAPLNIGEETIGVLSITGTGLSEADIPAVTTFANQTAIAMQNTRLYTQAQQEITERKLAEEKLEEERILLRTLIDNLPDRIYAMDIRGRKVLSNIADWQASGGKTMEDVIGKTDLDIYPPELAKEYWAQSKSVIDSGISSINREEVGLDPQGKRVWVLSSKVPLRDGRGNVAGLVGIGRDITERKRTEEELIKSEAKFRAIFDNASTGMFIVDLQAQKFFMCNSTCAKLLGYAKEEFLDLDIADIHPGEDMPFINEQIGKFSRGEEGIRSDIKFKRKNGSIFATDLSPAILTIADKEYLLISFIDITERKEAEETLRKSEKRFRALVENSLEEISLVAADGSLKWESPTRRRPLGYPPNSLVGHSLFEISHPDEREAVTQLLGQILETPGNMREGVYRLRHQDGSWRWMEAVITNLLDEPAVRSIVINYRDITERKQKEEEIQSRTEELSVLYQLSRALGDAKDLENVMALVTRHAVESVHTTFACIALVEDKELVPREVYPIRYMEHDLILGHRQAITALPLCQQVLDKNEPVILQAGNSEIGNVERDILMLDFVQSVCLVPMWVGGPSQHLNLALGLLILGEARQEKREPFTTEKIRLARSIGDQAATAIRRLVLREQAGRRLQHLASLSEIDRTIASNFDLRISLHVLLKHVIEQLNVDAADVLVLNNNTKALEYASGSGFRSKGIEGSSQPMDEGQAGRALLERQIVKIPNVAASGVDFAHPELLKAENIEAYFSVPLITKGQVVGVLEICHRTPLDPNEEWLDFLRTLAGQAAIAIDNVHMFESLQKTTDELELAYDATIEGWSHALDLRDKETEGHTQRVTEVTVELARSFGLSEADLVQIRWGALLHDIGKMGVPDSILLKPSTLTEDEWVVMRKHPDLAYEMLLPIRHLHGALDIPYCHHEWWDGTGYPRGLKGGEIPLAARIFAVVDVWDALISDRPYRPAWSVEKARRHIETGSGTHFDPQVVIKFLLGHS